MPRLADADADADGMIYTRESQNFVIEHRDGTYQVVCLGIN